MGEALRAPEPDDAHDPPETEAATADIITIEELRRRALEQAEAEAAVAAVMRREDEKATARAVLESHRAGKPTPLRLVALVALVAFNAYAWFGHPDWMDYHQPIMPSPDYYESSWKVAVYLQRQKIEEYRMVHGRVPESARVAGPPVHGVAYAPLSPSQYQLSAGAGRRQIVYRSGDSLAVILGRSLVTVGLISGGVR